MTSGRSYAQVFDQGCYVIGHRLVGHRAAIGGAAVGLKVHAYDLPFLREQRQDFTEHLDGADAAVQQNQGLAFAVNLVVHFRGR